MKVAQEVLGLRLTDGPQIAQDWNAWTHLVKAMGLQLKSKITHWLTGHHAIFNRGR